MKTIKLPIQNNIDTQEFQDIQRIYSSAVRFAYNRLLEDKSEKVIRALMKDKFLIGSWLVQCAIKQAFAIRDSQKELKIPKIIFGTKKNFILRQQNKITKEEYKELRLLNVVSQGEKSQKGNRHAIINVINANQIIFKPNKNTVFNIQLPKLRKNIKKELSALEIVANNKWIAFQISVNKNYIYITFDESIVYKKEQIKRDASRVLGIDLNPNYIGYSVLEFNQDNSFRVLYKEVVNITSLNSHISSKKDFEYYQITKRIISVANKFNVNKLVLEKLNIKSRNHNKGIKFNKLINNDWNRNILTASLKKHCNIFGIEYIEVNAAYSSTVGNILYADNKTPDMVASSIEIARRGYKKYEKLWFYPPMKITANLGTKNQWKEDLFSMCDSWVKVHKEIKNKGLKYRVQLEECIPDAVCRFMSRKSYVTLHNFKEADYFNF
jgi:IS605 OrfB family transposase